MRAIWKGYISFGLVNIPVRLYSAVEDRTISFDFLHKDDNSRIRFARVCEKEDHEVPYDQIVRGFPMGGGEYVVLTSEDFKKADVKRSSSIEIINFSNSDEVNTVFYEKPYYLEPDKGAERSYRLFMEALSRTDRVGIAKYVLRNREHLALLKAAGKVIVLQQLRFANEVRSPAQLHVPDIALPEIQVEMAITLINQLTKKFIPEDYRDDYTEELRQIIDQKAAGKVPAYHGKPPEPTEYKDIMDLLRKSIDQQKIKSR